MLHQTIIISINNDIVYICMFPAVRDLRGSGGSHLGRQGIGVGRIRGGHGDAPVLDVRDGSVALVGLQGQPAGRAAAGGVHAAAAQGGEHEQAGNDHHDGNQGE